MKKYVLTVGAVLILAAGAVTVSQLKILKNPKPDEKLIYYTIGQEDTDLSKVNDALNQLLSERYQITVDYRKLDWNIYGDKITNNLNLNEQMDVVFASSVQQGDYVGNARNGAWYPLDEFLEGEGHALYEAIPEIWWEGARIEGHIYGVPTSKELASVEHWMYPKELIDKYQIDIDSLERIEDLEPIFAKIKQEEPDYTVMELNQYSCNFWAVDGYEYIIDYQIPLMVDELDKEVKVFNIMETREGEEVLRTLRKYYLEGYISSDAPIRESQTIQKGEKVFWRHAQGGPYAELEWSKQRGYEIVAKTIGPIVINTDSLRGAYMCIPRSSKRPEEACRFLEAVNTDADVRNLLAYGIEGENYTLSDNGQVKMQKDSYTGVDYTQGNYFLLRTRTDQPTDLWDKFQEFNDSAVRSETLFFEPDISKIENEIKAVRKVAEKFYPALMTGSVDVDEYLPLYREELKKAGIETIKDEVQKQLSQWKKNEEGKEQ